MKQKKFSFPRLSRRGKLTRNLGIAVFLILASWVLAGCPAWTQNGALRQFERTMLLSPGTLRYQETGDLIWDSLVLVTGEDYAYTAELRRENTPFWPEVYDFSLELAPLGEDPLPIPLSRGQLWYSDESAILLCLNAPEGTARAEMTLTGYYQCQEEVRTGGTSASRTWEDTRSFQGSGELVGEDLVRLTFPAEGTEMQDILERLVYETGDYRWTYEAQAGTRTLLRAEYQIDFYRGDGSLIQSSSGPWEYPRQFPRS